MRSSVVALLVSATSPALADPQRPVTLQIEGCDDAAEIRRIVAIELGTDVPEPGRAQTTRALISCAGAMAMLRVEQQPLDKALSRSLDLSTAIAKGRARLIALAVVELIATSFSELDPDTDTTPRAPANAEPRLERGTPQDTVATGARAPAQHERQLHIFARGGALAFSSDTGVLAGGGVRVMRTARTIAALLDVAAHRGSDEVSLGRVSIDIVDAAAALAVHADWSRTRAYLGIGSRGGAVRLAGSADNANVRSDRFWAPWLGALATCQIEHAATSRVLIGIGIEAGLVIYPVGALVADRRELAVDGAWIGVHVGIGAIL